MLYLGIALILIAGFPFLEAEYLVYGKNCDLPELVQWGVTMSSDDGAVWEQILVEHSFTLLCKQIDIVVRNLAGCTALFADVAFLADKNLDEDSLDVFYKYLGYIQHYCGSANFTKLCTRSTNVYGCATAAAGTTQEMIKGKLDDIWNVCRTYHRVIDVFEKCVNDTFADCTDTEQKQLYAGIEVVLDYFKTGAEYCAKGCGDALKIIASQDERCDYVIDYSLHSWDKYCDYISQGVKCIDRIWTACPAVTNNNINNTQLARNEMLIYSDLLGCDFDVAGYTIGKVNDSVSMGNCTWKVLQCIKGIAIVAGVTTDNTIHGGYSIAKANLVFDKYVEQLVRSKSFYEICQFINNRIWDTIQDCVYGIELGCSNFIKNNDEYIANMYITNYIGKYIDQTCSKGCTELQDAFEGINVCVQGLTFKGLDMRTTLIDFVRFAAFTLGEQIEFCKVLFKYVDCVLPKFMECDIIYQNWIELISGLSDVKWSVAFCNIQVNLENGEFTLLTNKFNGWLRLDRNWKSAAYMLVPSWFSLLILIFLLKVINSQ